MLTTGEKAGNKRLAFSFKERLDPTYIAHNSVGISLRGLKWAGLQPRSMWQGQAFVRHK